MRVELSSGEAQAVEADVLAVPLADPSPPLPAAASELDRKLEGRLARVAEEEAVAKTAGQTAILHTEKGRVVATGLGPGAALDADSVRTAAAGVARATATIGGTVAWLVDDGLTLPPVEQARAAVDGLALGGYDPGRWKANGDRPKQFERLVLLGADQAALAAAERAARVADAANRARDLVNGPPNEVTPEHLAARAEEIAAAHGHLSAEALGPDEIHALGMGAFAAVAQGSHNPPRLIVLRYEPPEPTAGIVLGLVGKGITFDTGGISLKPAPYMEDMKSDMAGAAAVLEAWAPSPSSASDSAPSGRRRDREHARRGRVPARRRPPRDERQDDRGHQHGRRRPARARRRAHVRARAGRHARRRLRDPHRRDAGRARRLLRGRVRQRPRLARTRSSRRGKQAATTPGRCRSTNASGATSTRRSPT